MGLRLDIRELHSESAAADPSYRWISLGRYNFAAGSVGHVLVTDAAYVGSYTDPTNKKILVDAVRWRKTH